MVWEDQKILRLCLKIFARSALIAIVTVILLNVIWLTYIYFLWRRDFSRRVSQFDAASPSRKLPPSPRKVTRVLRKSAREQIKIFIPHSEDILKRAKQVERVKFWEKVFSPRCPGPGIKKQLSGRLSHRRHRAHDLTMDYQRVSFIDFVWANYFITPNTAWLAVSGIVRLKLRELLHRVVCRRIGVPHPASCVDYSKLAGTLLLESAQLVQFRGIFKISGKKVATFVWPDMPLLGADGTLETDESFILSVDIDLTTKCLESATLNGEPLAARDVVILIWFNTISANHVKIHSYANWASNPCDFTYSRFQHRMAVATIIYNYFGETMFPRITYCLNKLGIISSSCHDITDVFHKGMTSGVPNHAGVQEIAMYSELASFLIPVRKYFHNVFTQHTDDFPGIDAEALFIGTVVHSLDHTVASWNLPDPLWLDKEGCEPRFRVMAEIGRLVRAGFVDDIPFLLFRKNFSNSPDKFYQRVYAHAARINKRLADHMDCCIIK